MYQTLLFWMAELQLLPNGQRRHTVVLMLVLVTVKGRSDIVIIKDPVDWPTPAKMETSALTYTQAPGSKVEVYQTICSHESQQPTGGCAASYRRIGLFVRSGIKVSVILYEQRQQLHSSGPEVVVLTDQRTMLRVKNKGQLCEYITNTNQAGSVRIRQRATREKATLSPKSKDAFVWTVAILGHLRLSYHHV